MSFAVTNFTATSPPARYRGARHRGAAPWREPLSSVAVGIIRPRVIAVRHAVTVAVPARPAIGLAVISVLPPVALTVRAFPVAGTPTPPVAIPCPIPRHPDVATTMSGRVFVLLVLHRCAVAQFNARVCRARERRGRRADGS